jgi:hypothetical protein
MGNFNYEFRNTLESLGPKGTVDVVKEMLSDGDLHPHNFSIGVSTKVVKTIKRNT